MKPQITGHRNLQSVPPPIGEAATHWVFAGLIRKIEYFERAFGLVNDEVFREHERWLKFVWSRVVKFYREQQKLPDKDTLCAICNSAIENNPQLISDADVIRLDEFITTTYEFTDEHWGEKELMSSLRQLLENRLLLTTRDLLSKSSTPELLCTVFTNLAETAADLETLSSPGLSAQFADGWLDDDQRSERIPTGIKFLDAFLDGGQLRGESYGLVGPTGGGKTTIGVMLAAEAALRSDQEWQRVGGTGQPQRAYFVSYEETADAMRLKALSYVAGIPKKRLEQMIHASDFSSLSTAGNLQPYEMRRYQQMIRAGQTPPCEESRFKDAIERLNRNLRFVDFTGVSDAAGHVRGHGLVDENAALVCDDLTGNPGVACSMILVDHVLAAVEAHIDFNARDNRAKRDMINRWPRDMRKKLAAPFNCPVWSLQQLNAKANEAKPGTMPPTITAEDGPAFAENCDFCFVLGIAKPNGMLPVVCDKHRRGRAIEPHVVQIRGDDCRVVDVSRKWIYDDRTKTICVRQKQMH